METTRFNGRGRTSRPLPDGLATDRNRSNTLITPTSTPCSSVTKRQRTSSAKIFSMIFADRSIYGTQNTTGVIISVTRRSTIASSGPALDEFHVVSPLAIAAKADPDDDPNSREDPFGLRRQAAGRPHQSPVRCVCHALSQKNSAVSRAVASVPIDFGIGFHHIVGRNDIVVPAI